MARPMGIMASFSKVTFKKDGAEVFSTTVTSGGCFGPNPDLDVINNGFKDLRSAIDAGKAKTTALDFNTVAIAGQFGGRSREYSVDAHSATHIDLKNIKPLTP